MTCPHAASGCDYPASECAGHCASKQQPEALRLADALENDLVGYDGMSIPRTGQNIADEAAAELRRLYAENEDFRATIDYLTRENAEQIGGIVALKEQRDENEKLREENAKLQKWIAGEAQVAGTLDRKLRKAYKQRDELLKALRRIADTSANQSGTGAQWVHWVDQAREAIAKATGEETK